MEAGHGCHLTDEQLELLSCSLYDLGLPQRTVNQLEARGIYTIEQLLMRRREDIEEIPNIGEKSLDEIYKCLANHGFHRKG